MLNLIKQQIKNLLLSISELKLFHLYAIIVLLIGFIFSGILCYSSFNYIYLSNKCDSPYYTEIINYSNNTLYLEIFENGGPIYYEINNCVNYTIKNSYIMVYKQCVLIVHDLEIYSLNPLAIILMNQIIAKVLFFPVGFITLILFIMYCIYLIFIIFKSLKLYTTKNIVKYEEYDEL